MIVSYAHSMRFSFSQFLASVIFVMSVVGMYMLAPSTIFAAACQSAGSGNWSDVGTWTSCGGTTPQSSDTVEILNTHTVTLNTNTTVASTTIAVGGILTEDGGGRLLTLTAGWSNSGTFNAGNGTVRFGNTNGTLTMQGNTTFNNLVFNTGAVGSRVINLAGYTATTSGTFVFSNSSSGSISLTGGGMVAALGDVYWSATSTGNTNTTMLSMAGTGSQTLTVLGAGNTTGDFAPFVINKSSGTLTLVGPIRTRNSWTYTQGTIDASTNSTTVTFASSVTISGSHTLYNVRFDNNSTSGSTYTISNTLTVAGTLSVDNTSTGDLVLGTGTIIALGDINVDTPNIGSFGLTGSVIIAGTGAQTFTVIDGTTTSGLFASTTVNKSSGTLTMVGVYRTGLNFNIAAGTVDWTTNDATLAIAGSITFNPGSTVYDNIYISSNTLTLSSSLTLQGNWTNASSFTSGANTVTFTGTGTSTVITGGTGTNQDFQNFTVNKSSGGVVQLSTNGLDADGTLTISGGMLDLNGQNISTTATCNNSGTLKLLGTETVSCTPTNNSGSTIHFYGAGDAVVAEAGSSIHHFVASAGKTLIFPADTTTTIGGTLTLDGDSGSGITIKSSAAGTDGTKYGDTALISVATASTIDYVTVYDNDASGAATPLQNTNSTNGGNTTGWDFGEPADVTAPVISNISASPTSSSVTITWTTDEVATSSVAYGVTSSYTATSSTASYTTSHSITLSGLSNQTTYHYRVASRDPSGNIAYSSDQTFTTVDQNTPSVYLIAPVTGTTVFGPQVFLYATVTDETAVSVQFKHDTNTLIGSEVKEPPYILSWDTTGLSGSHTVVAVARDSGGNYATSTASTVTVSAAGAKYITPGAGFSGATSQPAQVGTGTAADQKPMARWDTIPFQTFDDTINVGVVAFHMNDIERVSFSANGGVWTDVYQATRNPETNVVEYWATLNADSFTDGDVEVRAIVYPRAGIPRVLQGSITYGDDSGEISLFLTANADGTFSDSIRYVATTGNDTTGDGSLGNPFLTITQAIADVATDNGTSDGALVYLQEGSYAAPGGETTATDRWVTITRAPGADRADVKIVSQGRPKTPLLHLYDITMIPYTTTLFEGYSDSAERSLWIDRVSMLGPGRYETQTDIFNSYRIWVTDTYWTDTANGPTGAFLVRNTITETIRSDAYQNSTLVVSSFVDDIDPSDSGAHPDFYQLYTPTYLAENIILYGIDARNMYAQGIFVGALQPSTSLEGIAIVDVILRYVDPTGNPIDFSSQYSATTTHAVIDNLQVYDQSWLWRGSEIENMVVRDSIFETMDVSGPSASTILNAVYFSGNTLLDASGSFSGVDVGSDTDGPSVSSISSGTPGDTSATITWTTDELSDTQVEYGLTTSYSASSTLNATPTTSHSVSLTGLTTGQTYHYRVRSRDLSGNETNSSDQTFMASSVPDTDNPVISAVSATGGETTATVTWTTDEAATSQVAYGTGSGSYGTYSTRNASLETSHSVSLSGLTAETTYYYVVNSLDASGNSATSSESSFTTQTAAGGGEEENSGGGGGGGGGGSTSAPQASVSVPSQPQVPVFVFTRDLEFGATGPDVVALQNILIAQGYLVPGYNTGFFGSLTRNALIAYQTAKNITPAAGYFGLKTRASILSPSQPILVEIQPAVILPTTPTQLTVSLSLGANNPQVKTLQEILKKIPGIYPQGIVSGYFGGLTQQAVQRFQLQYGIVANEFEPGYGIVGPKTRERLNVLNTLY